MDNIDCALPNIYYATVAANNGVTVHLYVAADFTGAAISKVSNLCVENFGFRPYRSTAVIKLRRLKLQDYVEHPECLHLAIQSARQLGEVETVNRLAHRPRQVNAALIAGGYRVDTAAVAAALGEALRSIEVHVA